MIDYTCCVCGEWSAETPEEIAQAEREGFWECPDCAAIDRIMAFPYTNDRGAFAPIFNADTHRAVTVDDTVGKLQRLALNLRRL